MIPHLKMTPKIALEVVSNYLKCGLIASSSDIWSMASSSSDKSPSIKDMLNKIVEGKIDANRRYVDEVLEKLEDANHRYYLNLLIIELQRMEIEEKAGNLHAAFQHKVMAETYKGILENTFGVST